MEGDKLLLFWRDGAMEGRSGYYVRAASLNKVVPEWIERGIKVVGIRLDPANEGNIDVLIAGDVEAPHA